MSFSSEKLIKLNGENEKLFQIYELNIFLYRNKFQVSHEVHF